MPLVRVLKEYDNAEHAGIGDVLDITDPFTLIKEGKVELVDEETIAKQTEKAVLPNRPVTAKLPPKAPITTISKPATSK